MFGVVVQFLFESGNGDAEIIAAKIKRAVRQSENPENGALLRGKARLVVGWQMQGVKKLKGSAGVNSDWQKALLDACFFAIHK